MQIISDNDSLKALVNDWRMRGEKTGFVPTMGNLHAGHLKLVNVARQHADRVVTSIFVNPMQFNQSTDFAAYPRTLEEDKDKLLQAGTDVLYCPDESSIYPEGMINSTRVLVPDLTDVLCGEYRPGHFEGVATVVTKLFNIVEPQVAIFGEKDFQQLQVIRKMVRDLDFPISIVGVPTEREASGLALSSRNQYLSAEEKITAAGLYRTLMQVAEQVMLQCKKPSGKEKNFYDIEADAMQKLVELGFKPEYLQVRREENLQSAGPTDKNIRVFGAAWLGKARLIDNVQVILNA